MSSQIMNAKRAISNGEEFFMRASEVKVKDAFGHISFYTLADLEGEPLFYQNERSIIDDLIRDNDENGNGEGIEAFGMEYSDYEEVFTLEDSSEKEILRYLIYLVCADEKESERFIAATKGKNIEQIDIAATDMEEEM